MRNLQRLGVLGVLAIGSTMVGWPRRAPGRQQISGVGVFDTSGSLALALLAAMTTSSVTRRSC